MSDRRIFLVDANVLLRFLTNEQAEHTAASCDLIEAAAAGEVMLRIPEVTVYDVFYTLSGKRIHMTRAESARKLSLLLQQPGFEVDNRDQVMRILVLCEEHNISYCDASIAVAAMRGHLEVASFDQDFRKIPGVKLVPPTQWLKERERGKPRKK